MKLFSVVSNLAQHRLLLQALVLIKHANAAELLRVLKITWKFKEV